MRSVARQFRVSLSTVRLWVERGEKGTVESSGRVYPGLYVSGMAANAVHGAFRIRPIFGGMLLSGRKVAKLIQEELA